MLSGGGSLDENSDYNFEANSWYNSESDSLGDSKGDSERNSELISTSIGMYNVNERIKLFYGDKSGISIESKVGEGTTVFLKIYV